MAVTFLPDMVEDFLSTTPRPYTSNPFSLVRVDISLFFHNIFYLFNIVKPLTPWLSGELDELNPSGPNLFALALHILLIILQLVFIISLPMCLGFPLGGVIVYVAAFFLLNQAVCKVLNGPSGVLHVSKTDLSRFPKRPNEKWIFLNGVAAGYVC
jgi:hypothetical protein